MIVVVSVRVYSKEQSWAVSNEYRINYEIGNFLTAIRA